MTNLSFLKWTVLLTFANLNAQTYSFPDEAEPHEGTWLAWPHQYEYGSAYRNENDATWVAMTNALQANENVHIIAYNNTEKNRIITLLNNANVPLTHVNFVIGQTNDVWMRDTAGIYVRNGSGNLVMLDWGFNGWGDDYGFAKDNLVPTVMGNATGMTPVNLNNVLIMEGGSWEMDGAGTFLATKSAVLAQTNPTTPTGINAVRNPGKTQAQVEVTMAQYTGATKFIWLDGWFSQDDITDAHIDGFAKFAPGNKLVTMSQTDLLYWGASQADIDILFNATNANNVVYTKVFIPLTANNVKKTNGQDLGYKGSYANYYVANNRVLVPNYNDPNDATANSIIGSLYPGRAVVGIDVRNLYANGGMIHCVTQQQPAAGTLSNEDFNDEGNEIQFFPNPSAEQANLLFRLKENKKIRIEFYDSIGKKVHEIKEQNLNAGTTTVSVPTGHLKSGIYFCNILSENTAIASKKIIIK